MSLLLKNTLIDDCFKEKNRMPMVIKEILVNGYEKVVEVKNEEAGLHAIIAIHNTALGPALGGTRIYPYSTFEDALADVLRLSKGMTSKSALAETGMGGGKSVIIANPKTQKTENLLLAFAEAVQSLNGQYICAEDSGSTAEDMLVIRKGTPYVAGLPTPSSSGDPGRFTAWGMLKGLKAVAKKLWGSESLKGRKIAIQGLGSVGARLAEFLFWEEAKLILSDIDEAKVARLTGLYKAQSVSPNEILFVECDILSPCAFGAVINESTIPKLHCKAIAGAANNQLLNVENDGLALFNKGILYAPDFIINAGGVINAALELEEDLYNPQQAIEKTNRLYDTLLQIFETAEKKKMPTVQVALDLVEYKLQHGIGKRTREVHFR
jgi:leucine dehydrogenase